MHPTPNEQLLAIMRRIEQVATDPSLAPESRDALGDAQRLLRRLERSWDARLPFLLLDNQLAVELLDSIAPLVPELAAEIKAAAAESSSRFTETAVFTETAAFTEAAVHDLNKRLQGLLGRAVHLLPDDPEGDDGRARIADHLRSRLAADPALHRTPAERRPPGPQPQQEISS